MIPGISNSIISLKKLHPKCTGPDWETLNKKILFSRGSARVNPCGRPGGSALWQESWGREGEADVLFGAKIVIEAYRAYISAYFFDKQNRNSHSIF